jgi:protein TonB
MFIGIGLVIALSIGLVAFEWRTFEEKLAQVMDMAIDEEIEEKIFAVQPSTPPPPPPPPPTVVEVLEIVENDVEVENEMQVQDVETNENENINTDIVESTEVVSDDNEVFQVVEDMPRFKGCEKERNEEDAAKCFQEKLYGFLSQNIKYPQQAKELGIQGKVFISFVIEKDGSVANVEILRGIGGGCDEEAERVIKKLPTFTPGKQRGRPARVQYRLPISFTLK